MKVTSNARDVLKSLQAAQLVIERKMKAMVVGFAMEVAATASMNTPRGSEWALANNEKYRSMYLAREQDLKIPAEVGFHKGAWQYSEGDPVFIPTIFEKQAMLGNVTSEARTAYQLGDNFKIGAEGPAYGMLEARSDGIIQPTIQQIMTAHSSDLKRYFNAG